jgi:hypothetical protein
MEWLYKIFEVALVVALLALLIEIIFRMIGRFSAEAREVFRWVYIVGCGGLVLTLLINGLSRTTELARQFSPVSKWVLVIPVVALIMAILLNKKEIK